MVKRFIALIHREFSGITEAAFLLGGFAFLSQILGLVRDRALAHIIGPSATLDIYYAAFRIPDLLFNSIATMVSITVLIPFIIEKLGTGDEEGINRSRKFLSEIFTAFMAVMAIASIAFFIFMPQLSRMVAPGFSPDEIAQLTTMSRVMLLSPIFFGLSNLFGTVTQLYRRFFVYALSPLLYNLGILLGIYFLLPMMGPMGLAWGVVIGAMLHMLIQVPILIRHRFIPQLTSHYSWGELRRVLYLSLPRTLGLSLNSFALLAIISIASTLREGSISIFSFAFNLQAVPISIIGVSYSVAAFPTLAKAFTGGKMDEFRAHIISAARQIISLSLPIMALFIVLRAHIVRIVLGTGNFSWDDTRLTAAALAIFSLAVVSQSLIVLLVRGYYAAGKTQRPLLINVFFTVSEIIFAFLFLQAYRSFEMFRYFFDSLFRVQDVVGTEILMLPLGYAFGILFNFVGLWIIFKKDYLNGERVDLRRAFFQSIGASFILGFVTYKMLDVFALVFDTGTFPGLLLQGSAAAVIGVIAAGCVLWLLKNKEYMEISTALHKKIWKAPVIAPDQDDLV